MGEISNSKWQLTSIPQLWKIVGMLIFVSIVGGCVSRDVQTGTEIPSLNISNTTEVQEVPDNDTSPNQIRLTIRSDELKETGKLPIVLKIIYPVLNDTVVTVFKPEFGSVWQEKVDINETKITDNTWTRNYTVTPKGNTSYVLMYVEISSNDTIVRKGAWNITFEAPGG